MDAKAEAEKRYGRYIDPAEGAAFLAGAAWALRQFGDVLTREGWSHSPTWFAAEAHHIADRIESGA